MRDVFLPNTVGGLARLRNKLLTTITALTDPVVVPCFRHQPVPNLPREEYRRIDSNFIMVEREFATLLILQHPGMYILEIPDLLEEIQRKYG